MAHAHAYRGLAYWVLDRPAQARRSFDFNAAALVPRDRILVDAFKAITLLPHPLPNSDAIADIYAGLVDAGFRAFGDLLVRLVQLDANDVELSAAELETLREFDRFGGRAVDVAKGARQVTLHRAKSDPKRDQEARVLRPRRGLGVRAAARLARPRL